MGRKERVMDWESPVPGEENLLWENKAEQEAPGAEGVRAGTS